MMKRLTTRPRSAPAIHPTVWQLRKRRRRIDELEQDIQTYDKILHDTQTENGRLREELEQTQRQLAKFAGCPELGIAYKMQDVGTLVDQVKAMCSITARDHGSNVEIHGRLAVGMLEVDNE